MFRSTVVRWVTAVGVALVLVGCGGGDPEQTEGPSTTAPADPAGAGSPETTDGSGSSEAVDLAEWQTIELVDASGETFTFADLVGRPVFVETFATWCGNCRRQLGDTNQAAGQAGDGAVFVALSVETDLDGNDMADYAAKQGFDHVRFAVMTPEMLAAVKDAFGNTALNPPSTPHVIMAADGSAGDLKTGYDSPEAILTSLGLG